MKGDKLYRVPIKACFNGFAIVEAPSEAEAEIRACAYLNCSLGNVTTSDIVNIKDFCVDIKGLFEIRDNESVEEVYEGN